MRYLMAILGTALTAAAQGDRPVFSFGVMADVQYADQDTLGPRAYRASVDKLQECTAALARERLAFVIQLGDLVDGGLNNLERILPLWERVPGPRYHVLGNHDFVAPRDTLLARMKMPRAYYDFTAHDWRFVVLDGMNVSVAGGWSETDPHAGAAAELLAGLKRQGARNAQTWNGAIGPQQREWLAHTLADAAAKKQRAIVFCHHPVLAESCRPDHLLWDHSEVLAVLEVQPALAAYMNGHDHRGGYAMRTGIHYITFAGMVEHEASATCNVVDVFGDRLVVRSAGQPGGRSFSLKVVSR
jgi:manganese-dependent ADP-ribose/CDP-alcohol diphosphatase